MPFIFKVATAFNINPTHPIPKKKKTLSLSRKFTPHPAVTNTQPTHQLQHFPSQTPTMKTSTITILLFTALASACADNAFRCLHPSGSQNDDTIQTTECSKQLGLVPDSCYCTHRTEYFVEVPQEKFQAFVDCCQSVDGGKYLEC